MKLYVIIIASVCYLLGCSSAKKLESAPTIVTSMPTDSTFQYVRIRNTNEKKVISYLWVRRENDSLIVAATLQGPSRLPPHNAKEVTLHLSEIAEIYQNDPRATKFGILGGLVATVPMLLVAKKSHDLSQNADNYGGAIFFGFSAYALALLSPLPVIDGVLGMSDYNRKYIYRNESE